MQIPFQTKQTNQDDNSKRKFLHSFSLGNFSYIIIGLLFLTFFPNIVFANLCNKNNVTDRYREEAKLINSESFAPADPDYRGDADYNAWVLACNRKRDGDGKKIDKAIDPATGGNFADDLTPFVVKGKYHFYGHHLALGTATDLKYRYRLHRNKGKWIVTLPIKLNFPNKPLKNRLDISYELAFQLGLMSTNGQGSLKCDKSKVKMSSKKKKGKALVNIGYLDNTYDGLACRLPRNFKLDDGTKLLGHYYKFWRQAIRKAWNREGFVIRVKFLGHDRISDDLMTSFKKDNLTWKIYLSLKPKQRPRYVPGFARLKHIHTGAYGNTIAHEAGHYLGLDDEYREKNKGAKNDWRNCIKQGGTNYIMCSAQYAKLNSDHYTLPGGISNPESAKGIYAWIITRRYSSGKAEFCNTQNDCKSSEYCAKTLLDLKRKHCVARKAVGAKCSTDKQCKNGTVCKGKPIGKCANTSSPTCSSGWNYEIRNPLNKDRCNQTVTRTRALKCKLLVTDKAKNWTGPHAKKGADECRSKKGKKPKGVKCPGGYKYRIKSGADTCIKTTVNHRIPTCPARYSYKSLRGKDECRSQK